MDNRIQGSASASDVWDAAGQQDAAAAEAADPIEREPSASLTGAIVPQTATAHLIGIFGEAHRVAAKSRLLFGSVKSNTGLTGSEVLTLVAIVHASLPPTVPQVGRFLGSPRQVIQRAIKVLEQQDFIAALPNPEHKRAPLLLPTDKGRRTVAEIDAATQRIVAELAVGCDVEQLGATHAGLLALREHVDRHLGIEDY